MRGSRLEVLTGATARGNSRVPIEFESQEVGCCPATPVVLVSADEVDAFPSDSVIDDRMFGGGEWVLTWCPL
jgi:hypothetical protein